MRIAGKDFKVSTSEIPIDNIEVNYDQPRRQAIALRLASKGLDPHLAKEPEGIKWSRRFRQLVNGIIANKGISMPIVVQEQPNGKFFLIDGDRRIGAVKYILQNEKILQANPELKQNLAKIPCLVVNGVLTEDECLVLLSHIHVQIQGWPATAKSDIIEQLEKEHGKEETAAILGTPIEQVTRAVDAVEIAKKFSFKQPYALSWGKRISRMRRGLVDAKVLDATVDKVRREVVKGVRNLDVLPKILKDPDAKAKYLEPNSNINDCLQVLKEKDLEKSLEAPGVSFKHILSRLILALKSVKFDNMRKYKGSKEMAESLDQCMELLKSFKETIVPPA